METLLIVALLLILLVGATQLRKLQREFLNALFLMEDRLSERMRENAEKQAKELAELRAQLEKDKVTISENVIRIEPKTEAKPEAMPEIMEAPVVPILTKVEEDAKNEIEPIPIFNRVDQEIPIETAVKEETPLPTEVEESLEEEQYTEPAYSSWFNKQGLDWEQFIGENLLSKVGILVLVLGIGYFVKYAIDQEWINEFWRMMLGFGAGTALMALSGKLREKFQAFSTVFVAGAIATYYFTVYIAYQQYGLLGQTGGFSILVLCTLLSVWLSLKYNQQELALLSLAGGFITPFMVSSGEGNYLVLFAYLAILNSGMLILALYRNWRWVQYLSFVGTWLIFLIWVKQDILSEEVSIKHAHAFLFTCIYFAIFLAAELINHLKVRLGSPPFELGLILINTSIVFFLGIELLDTWHPTWKGLFTFSLGLVYLLQTIMVRRSNQVQTPLFYISLGLALTYFTLTAPIELEGTQITFFWATEAVLLFWLSQKSGNEMYRYCVYLLTCLTLISLVLDWNNVYQPGKFHPILNQAIGTSLFVLISLFAQMWLGKKDKDLDYSWLQKEHHQIANKSGLFWVSVCLIYFGTFIELHNAFTLWFPVEASASGMLIVVHLIFAAIAQGFVFKRFNENADIIKLCNAIISFILFLAIYQKLYEIGTDKSYPIIFGYLYWFHFIALASVIWMVKTVLPFAYKVQKKVLAYALLISVTVICSQEISLHGASYFIISWPASNYADWYFDLKDFEGMIVRTWYPIFWGIVSLLAMLIGVRKHYKDLRIASLALVGLTLLKLFFYDIRNASQGGKIAAFILLGILLLIISFTYQKIKEVLLKDEEAQE